MRPSGGFCWDMSFKHMSSFSQKARLQALASSQVVPPFLYTEKPRGEKNASCDYLKNSPIDLHSNAAVTRWL